MSEFTNPCPMGGVLADDTATQPCPRCGRVLTPGSRWPDHSRESRPLPLITYEELGVDEAEAYGVDSTLRTNPSLPVVRVTVSDGVTVQTFVGLFTATPW